LKICFEQKSFNALLYINQRDGKKY